jgi:magnesium-transporting ATPase (P-type)
MIPKTDNNKNNYSDWYNLSPGEVFKLLQVDENGLNDQQFHQQHVKYGDNLLRQARRRTAFIRFVSQFNNVLLYVLLAAAALTVFLRHWADAGVIIGVVVINAVIGFIQEGKAEKALQTIQSMLSLQARVRRNGRFVTVPAEKIVPGDVMLIHSGDRVSADIRLFETNSLQMQESVLTGESAAVDKSIEKVKSNTPLGDRGCMAYAGTLVTNGTGMGVVVETAKRTEIGKISTLLDEVESITTPLLRKINIFNRWLTASILIVALGIFIIGVYIQDFTIDEMFLATVGFAVAAIPEGLPPVLTITLAVGVTHLAKHNVIVRRLPAVETLGSVTVICSDKTGTLTHNELMVQSVVTSQVSATVTGNGYEPEGEIIADNKLINPSKSKELTLAAQAAILCNDSELTLSGANWRLHGNPVDGALLAFGAKAKLDTHFERSSKPRSDLIPFESQHKFMATLHHDHESHGYIFIKGAAEVVLDMCEYQYHEDESVPIQTQYWIDKIELLAKHAQKVLAIAYKPTDANHTHLNFNDVKNGLTLIALFGLMDPPREDAIEAVNKCLQAGICVKMITGDHATTAKAISMEFGFDKKGAVYTGSDLDTLTDEEFDIVANSVNIFARTTPEHKLRIVRSLQKTGNIVGMTGDGVNDAPALKRADIGIAMGKKGTEASKEAADIVLVDDNFASIAQAVEMGRKIYDNFTKTILMIVPTSGGEALVILSAILFAQVLPITPLQILWVNMVTAVSLGIALAFEVSEANIMSRKPRAPNESIFSKYFIWRLIFVSLIMVMGTFYLFNYEYLRSENLNAARTVAVNAIVFGEIFYLFNCRRITESSLSIEGILGNKVILIAVAIVVILQIILTYLPIMQTLFSTASIGIDSWGRIIVFGAGLFLLVELEKYIYKKNILPYKNSKMTNMIKT